MSNRILILILSIAVIVSFSCGGPKKNIGQWLYSIDPINGDTTNTIHVHLNDLPLSIELLFSSGKVIPDSVYEIHFQIWTTGLTGFKESALQLYPEDIDINIDGLQPIEETSHLAWPTEKLAQLARAMGENYEWRATSIHQVFFDLNEIKTHIKDDSLLHLTINLDKYAIYNDKPVEIEAIKAHDPWFRKKIDSLHVE